MRLLSTLRSSSLKIGDCVKEIRTINQYDLQQFSQLTKDFNSIHDQRQKSIVHGAFLNGIVAGIIGTKLPGDGSIVVSQNFSFPSKCLVDVPIEFRVQIVDVRKIIRVNYACSQNDKVVFEGEAKLIMNKTTTSD
jgi:acyl dehydratase